MATAQALFDFSLMLCDFNARLWDLKDLAFAQRSHRRLFQIGRTLFAFCECVALYTVWCVCWLQGVALMAWLSSTFLATLLAQTLRCRCLLEAFAAGWLGAVGAVEFELTF